MNAKVTLDYSKTVTLPLKVGNTYNLPLIATNDFLCAAISLIFLYPKDNIKINSVKLPDGEIVQFGTPNDEFRVGWFSATNTPMALKTGQAFMYINIEVIKDFTTDQSIKLTIVDSVDVEFADDNIQSIPMVFIKTEILKAKKQTVAEIKLAQEYVTKPISQTCSNCANLNGTKCGIGGFTVGKTAKCKLYK